MNQGVLVDADQSSPLIFGGRDAKPGEFSHQVSIQEHESSEFGHSCGGSIIAPLWILTAAHCLLNEVFQYRVVAEIMELNGTNPERQERNATKLINHPDFGFPYPENDIALIELDKPLEINKFIKTIQLSKAGLESEGKVGTIGWGKSRVQNEFKLKTHICTGSDLTEEGCHGDSGGPLIQKQQIIGVASFVDPECGKITVFTNVSCYIDFIKKHVKNVKH